MKKIIEKFKKLSVGKKAQLIVAMLLTIAVIAIIPTLAWFSYQRRAAEMFKVEYPNALYINAAQREDQVEFELGGININEYWRNDDGQLLDANGNVALNSSTAAKITKKQYVFSVSGSNTKKYILQLSHTTNNYFTYTVYHATQLDDEPKSGEYIKYTTTPDSHTENPFLAVGDDVVNTESAETKYYLKGSSINLGPLNADASDSTKAKNRSEDTKYYPKSYQGNTNVEERAIPLYWQSEVTASNADSNKRFCDYFILEVTWRDRSGKTIEDKETDIVYLSAKRTE